MSPTKTMTPACPPGESPEHKPRIVPADAAGIVSSASLLQGQATVAIEHNGSLYRLQATKQGKLILTK